jgi:hypothetical protein
VGAFAGGLVNQFVMAAIQAAPIHFDPYR